MTERAGRRIAELVSQLGDYAGGDGPVAGLTAAQWTALRYFSRANRFSRTVSAFAEFHGTTRGTASQTVQGLVLKGYLSRTRCASDGRSNRLDITAQARALLLRRDPLQRLVRASGGLSKAAQRALATGLGRMLTEVAADLNKPRFGMCQFCAHLRSTDCCREGETPYQCGLLEEPLDEPELEQLCINFG